MNRITMTMVLSGSLGMICFLTGTFASRADQKHDGKSAPSEKAAPHTENAKDAKHRVAIEIARDRATIMHEIYESTLHVMHKHYFRQGRAVLPARALEDVFSEIEDATKVTARWIAVNTKAMSIDHEPDSEFDKLAAREIANGQSHVELIHEGVYHRATPIPLGSGCVTCHTGLSAPPSKTPRFAGLIISIPISEVEVPENQK